MGQNKALLDIDGKPMIANVVDTLRKQIADISVIGNEPDAYSFLDLPVYPDAVESRGPLAGIYTALTHAQTSHCLVVACDLPFVSEALVRFLRENCAPYDILAFESDSGVEPLCAVYAKSCLPAIETQIKNKRHKVSALFEIVNTRIVRMDSGLPFFDQKAFLNVNTPAELSEARRRGKPHPPETPEKRDR